MSVTIPFRTLREIDKALQSPNLIAMRATLDQAKKAMQPMIDLAIEADRAERSGMYEIKLGLTS